MRKKPEKPIQLNGIREWGKVPRQQNRFYSIYGKSVSLQLPFGENLNGGYNENPGML